MGRNHSVTDIVNWNFRRVNLPDPWFRHLGDASKNFRMLVQGKPKNGKTDYVMKLTKMLAEHYGKVFYNSIEEGKSKTLQEAVVRNNMDEVKGKWMLAGPGERTFDGYWKKIIRPQSGQILVIDSLDYMKLTFDQYMQLHERFKNRKAIIVVCWSDPKDVVAKKIEYTMDMVVTVKNFKAHIRSRFGGNETYTIWEGNSNGQYKLL